MKWNPVEKGLPKVLHSVLICTDQGNICSGYLENRSKKRWYLHDQELAEELIIAWMPFPAPLKYTMQARTGEAFVTASPFIPEQITIKGNGEVISWGAKNDSAT